MTHPETDPVSVTLPIPCFNHQDLNAEDDTLSPNPGTGQIALTSKQEVSH